MVAQAPTMKALVKWCEHERQWMLNQVTAMRRGERHIATNGFDETAEWIDELERRVAELNALLADIAEGKYA